MLLPFHLCIFRILNDSLEIMGSGSARKCIAPFCPQVFLTFPSFLNILRPIPSKGPVDLMVSISTKHAHISCILLPTYMVPSRWDCQTHRKSQCALLFLNDWMNDRRGSKPFPYLPTKKWIWEGSSSSQEGFTLQQFLQRHQFDMLIWRLLDMWALQIKRHTQTQNTHQANKPRHPQ